jgi:hypothetical protein
MAHRTLPLLRNIRIATPCKAPWEEMEGDDRVRFCGRCAKNVYNISAMSEAEATALVRDHEGKLCTRLYRRRDGAVLTSDCPVGVRRRRITKLAVAAVALGGAGALLTLAPGWDDDDGGMLMGEMEVVPPEGLAHPSAEPLPSAGHDEPPVDLDQDRVPRLR